MRHNGFNNLMILCSYKLSVLSNISYISKFSSVRVFSLFIEIWVPFLFSHLNRIISSYKNGQAMDTVYLLIKNIVMIPLERTNKRSL